MRAIDGKVFRLFGKKLYASFSTNAFIRRPFVVDNLMSIWIKLKIRCPSACIEWSPRITTGTSFKDQGVWYKSYLSWNTKNKRRRGVWKVPNIEVNQEALNLSWLSRRCLRIPTNHSRTYCKKRQLRLYH